MCSVKLLVLVMKKHCVFHEVVTEFLYIVYVIFRLEGDTYLFFTPHGFWAPSQNCEKGLLTSSCLSVRIE
jgi:hypothetical protein